MSASDADIAEALQRSLTKHALAHRRGILDLPSDAAVGGPHCPPTVAVLKMQLDRSQHGPGLFSAAFSKLEKVPRPFLNLIVKRVASYHFSGITGVIVGAALTVFLAYLKQYSVATVLILQLAAVLITGIYLGITMLITKKDVVVFFNYFLTLLAGELLVLRILNQPALEYLDILVLGSGMLFAFGRIGCFMAGCCYGKPSKNGLSYSRHHTKNGFPRQLLHVRLLPVQLIESAWLFVLTGVSSLLLVYSSTPGIALTTFLLLLPLGRLTLEFYRGDPSRPYYYGVSQAQWTSIGIVLVVAVLQLIGILPFPQWQSFIYLTFFVLLIALLLTFRTCSIPELYSPDHIFEFLRLIGSFKKATPVPLRNSKAVHVRKTSQNIQVSVDTVIGEENLIIDHVSFSSINRPMQKGDAARLSNVLQATYTRKVHPVLIVDDNNIYHLIHRRMS